MTADDQPVVTDLPESTVKRPKPLSLLERKLAQWGIDPASVADAEPEPPGDPVCQCSEPTESGACQGQWRVLDRSLKVWAVRCDSCGFEAGIPASRIDASVRRRALLEKAQLPERFAGLVFDEDGDNRDALFMLRSWLADFGKGDPLPAPAIWGEQGRGKSHLLTGLCTRLVREHGVEVMFRSVRELLRELQQFDDEMERGRVWERAVSVPVLALDDLGAQQITDWRHDQIAHLIDERYQAERPIVLATNFKPSAWGRIVDQRSASRLAGMTFGVQLKGRDRRQRQLDEGEGSNG